MTTWLREWVTTSARYWWHVVQLHAPKSYMKANGEEGFWCLSGASASFGGYPTVVLGRESRESYTGKWPMHWHVRTLAPAATATALAGHVAMAGWCSGWPVTEVTILYTAAGEFMLEVEMKMPLPLAGVRDTVYAVVDGLRPAGTFFRGYIARYTDRDFTISQENAARRVRA